MEEKNMRELSPEEMDKISGGANPGKECDHNWILCSSSDKEKILQCSKCKVIVIRFD